MKALVIKSFRFSEFKNNPKFSLEAAFTRLKAVLELLAQKSIEAVVLLPDDEYNAALENLEILDKCSVYPSSDSKKIKKLFNDIEKILVIDEQAFYVSKDLLDKVLALKDSADFATWKDSENLLYSFNYKDSCFFFSAPASKIVPNITPESSFAGLMQIALQSHNIAFYDVVSDDIPELYQRFLAFNPLPYNYYIEPTSRCNSRCSMCPFHGTNPEVMNGKIYLGEGGSDMPLEMFKKIIDEIDSEQWNYLPQYRQKMITAQLRGEPILAKNFKEMCQYVKSKNMILSFATNGNALDDNGMLEFLLGIGLDEITFSVDANRDLFNKIRPQLDYDKVVSNLKKLKALRDKHKYPTRIYSKTIFFGEMNEQLLNDTIHSFNNYVDACCFAFENYSDYKAGSKQFSSYFFNVDDHKRVPCLLLVDVVVVKSDGEVAMCFGCSDSSLGNAFEQNLITLIKNSPLRKNTLKNQSTKIWDDPGFCKFCTSWKAQYNRERGIEEFLIKENPIISQYYYQNSSIPINKASKPSFFKRIISKIIK